MLYLKLAWRDIVRQPLRLGLTVAAITFCAFALLLVMAFTRGQHQSWIQLAVSSYTGHFQFQRQGYLADPSLYRCYPAPEAELRRLESDPRVIGVAPRITAQGLASSDRGTAGVMIVGVDPVREARTTTLAKRVKAGAFLAAENPDAVVLGKGLAENLGVRVGDEIEVMVQSFYGSLQLQAYKVAGTVVTGTPEFDQSMLLMDLASLQDLIEMDGQVCETAVVLASPRVRTAVMSEAHSELDAAKLTELRLVPWEKVAPELYQFVVVDAAAGAVYISVLVIVVAFIVMLTITMSVLERVREFGVLLAIGAKPWRVFTLVMIESLLMGVVGTVLGLALATVPGYYVQTHPIEVPSLAETFAQYGMEPYIQALLIPEMYLGTIAIMLVIVIAVSIIPALRASRIQPVAALRYV